MTVDKGMNLAEVRALGDQLNAAAQKFEQMATMLHAKVSATSWVGTDARRFKDDWRPQHGHRLQQLRTDLDGFGQGAHNNPVEQEQASGVESAVVTALASGLVAALAGAAPSAPSGADTPGAEAGVLSNSDRSWRDTQAAYDANYRGYGLWRDGALGGENQYQCVSWAWFRMRELGFAGGQVRGDGGQLAGNLGGATSTVPHLGAAMSYGGHVVIAGGVTRPADGHLNVRVSEMNTDSNWAVSTRQEFRANREFVQNMDGTSSVGSRNLGAVTVFNPAYP